MIGFPSPSLEAAWGMEQAIKNTQFDRVVWMPTPAGCDITEEWGGLFAGRKHCCTHRTTWETGDCPGKEVDDDGPDDSASA